PVPPASPRPCHFHPQASPAPCHSLMPEKRKASEMLDSDSDTQDGPIFNIVRTHDEAIRMIRLESEQRRRDDLRAAFRRLKTVLPPAKQKGNKVFLVERTITHIRYLELTKQHLQTKLQAAEAETTRLCHLCEALMLDAAEHQQSAVHSAV
ncbi:hypothetical protein FOMPIDRAFT_33788, partial [Fomitopsis schrenkii]